MANRTAAYVGGVARSARKTETEEGGPAAALSDPVALATRAAIRSAGHGESAIRPGDWGQLEPAGSGRTVWAKDHHDARDIETAEVIRALLDSDEWHTHMRPVLERLDGARQVTADGGPRRGPRALYSAEQLESVVVLLQVIPGVETPRDAVRFLGAADQGPLRETLGFVEHQEANGTRCKRGAMTRGRRLRTHRDVPSGETVYRHMREFPNTERAPIMAAVIDGVRLADAPDLDPSASRSLYMDSSAMLTHVECPIRDSTTKVVVNRTVKDRATGLERERQRFCAEGGYVPPTKSNPEKAGKGFQSTTLVTRDGLPLAEVVSRIHESETKIGTTIVRDLASGRAASVDEHGRPRPAVAPLLDHLAGDRLRTLTTDGGFTRNETREECRRAGIVENMHRASHANRDTSHGNAHNLDVKRIPIDDPKAAGKFFVNGHSELRCACEDPDPRVRATKAPHTTIRSARIGSDRNGRVTVATQIRCTTCGTFTVGAHWKREGNPARIQRVTGHGFEPELNLGNPLTYNSLQARALGHNRFGHNEGYHGALNRGMSVFGQARWYRTKADAENHIRTTNLWLWMRARMLRQRRAAASTAPAAVMATPALAA